MSITSIGPIKGGIVIDSADSSIALIKPNVLPILDIFADSLIKNSDAYVAIIGYMDNSNNDVINNPLSFGHAGNTRDCLVRKGVLSQRINVNGRSSHEPATTNNTAASRAISRRVEIYVFELLSSAFHH